MHKITIDWWRLLRYSLLFLIYLLLMTVSVLLWFSDDLVDAWQKALVLDISQLRASIYLGFTFFIFISFPVLLFRFLFYFCKMLYRGRNPGVSVITYKTLFNPLNFLLFPSLLNPQGLLYRARCLRSLIFLILVYCFMLLII